MIKNVGTYTEDLKAIRADCARTRSAIDRAVASVCVLSAVGVFGAVCWIVSTIGRIIWDIL